MGPLLGGILGEISWRGPFFGVSALMAIALIATIVLVEKTPKPPHKTSLSAPLRALRHRGLLTMALTALCYNWGFFTVLGYAPFPMNLSPIKLGLVFTGWGILVALFAVFGAPMLQGRLGIARTMYLNLAAFAVVVLVIAIWTTDVAVLIPAVIVSGVFIGINNTVTTQAVMTVSPVERPVASAAYSFVRFIGGGLAPYAAGRLVVALNIHVPFYIASGAIVLGIIILSTAHRLLGDAERVQAEQVAAAAASTGMAGPASTGPASTGPASTRPASTGPAAAASGPATAMIPVEGTAAQRGHRPGQGVILAAVDPSPVAALVTEAAARLALADGQIVHVVHAQEGVTAGDVGIEAEDLDAARELVSAHLNRLAAHRVPAEGQVLLHAADHGGAGRLIAEYAASIRATTIVLGAPTHGGLPALMDASASQELWRHARSNLLIINPAAPPGPVTVNGFVPVAVAPGGSGARGREECADHLALPGQAGGGAGAAALDPAAGPAGQLLGGVRGPAQDGPDLVEGHREHVVQHERHPLGRGQRVQHHEHGQAHRVGQDGLMLGVGSRPGVPGHPGRPRVQRFLPP